MAELICPICGKEMHHAHSCPMVGGLVCEDCHMSCWMLDKTLSLHFCRYHLVMEEAKHGQE